MYCGPKAKKKILRKLHSQMAQMNSRAHLVRDGVGGCERQDVFIHRDGGGEGLVESDPPHS